MSDPDADRITLLEQRIQRLERLLGSTIVDAGPEAALKAVGTTPAEGPVRPQPAVAVPIAATIPEPSVVPGTAGRSIGTPGPSRALVTPKSPRPPARSFADLEEQLSGRLLAWVGGVALVLGAMFFLSLAFSRGWIGPEARVLIGLAGGVAAFGAGTWLFTRRQETPATVLTGVGVGTVSLALFAASRLYELIPIEMALLGSFVLAVVTGLVALRASSQAVAAFGLVATTLAPPVLGASPTILTLAFLATALVATAAVSVRRPWSWLGLIAFLATAPQAAFWVATEPSPEVVFVGTLAFWAVNVSGPIGRALDRRSWFVHPAGAILVTLSALWAVIVLHGSVEDPLTRSVGMLVIVAAHGVVALELLQRRPIGHPMGILSASVALGTLALGIALELGGIARPLAWTALALVVGWVATLNRDRLTATWAGVIGSLAIGDLVLIEYPLASFGRVRPDGVPFASPDGIVVIAMAAAAAVGGWMTWRSLAARPARDVRWSAEVALVAGALGAVGLLAYAAPFELFADLVVVAWSALALVVLGLFVFVTRDARASTVAAGAAGVLLGGAALVALGIVAPVDRLVVDPFGEPNPWAAWMLGPLSLAPLAAVMGLAGWLIGRRPVGRSDRPSREVLHVAAAAVLTGASIAIYLVSILVVALFQGRTRGSADPIETATQAQVALSIVWVLAGAVAFAFGLVRRISLARLFGLGVLSLAVAKVFLFDLAALDVAYRVLSLIGLGGVLLGSSFVANRFRPARTPVTTGDEPPSNGAATPVSRADLV
jgi:uncharacterized membrane protein